VLATNTLWVDTVFTARIPAQGGMVFNGYWKFRYTHNRRWKDSWVGSTPSKNWCPLIKSPLNCQRGTCELGDLETAMLVDDCAAN